MIFLRHTNHFLFCDQLLFEQYRALAYSLNEDYSGYPNKEMSHLDQPVEIPYKEQHLRSPKHGNNEGKHHCTDPQNSESPGENADNTCDQKRKSDGNTKEHMNVNNIQMKNPVQQSEYERTCPGKLSYPQKDAR